jgi:hypothetical protein
MQSSGEGRRTKQLQSLASAPILSSQSPALHNTWPHGFCSRRPASPSSIQPLNERLLSFHHGVLLHLRPVVLPGFALRVENDVNHSKHSSVAQSTRGQNRTLGPRKLEKSKRTPKISNRELQLLEPCLTYRKQSTDPRSNRELSTIVSNSSRSYKLEIITTGEFLRG